MPKVGYQQTVEHKRKIRQYAIGKKFTKEHRLHLSASMCGKGGAFRKGKSYEELYGEEKAKEIRQKLSVSAKGHRSWNKGATKESNKSMMKISLANRDRCCRRENDPRFVKCEICERYMKSITTLHLRKHNKTLNEYKVMFPENEIFGSAVKQSFLQGPPWNAGLKGAMVPWNKGLTKDIDDRIKRSGVKGSETRSKNIINGKIYNNWSAGLTKETDNRIRRKSEAMKGDKNPAKRAVVRDKIRRSLLKTYCDHPEIFRDRKISGMNQYSNKYTSIEKKIADLLVLLGIPFLHNAKIGRYVVDFCIAGKIIILCDGDYWHANPKFYNENFERRGKTAKEIWEKDDLMLIDLNTEGYDVLRFWECEIHNDIDAVMEKIQKRLNSGCKELPWT